VPEDTKTAVWLAAVQEQLNELAQAEQTLRTLRAHYHVECGRETLRLYARHDRLDEAEQILRSLLAKDDMDAACTTCSAQCCFAKETLRKQNASFVLRAATIDG